MSSTPKKKNNPKIPLIIDCTLEILRDHGEQGFAMRKVAAKAGMSLGNLQYYFKNKDELLAGVIDEYFGRCGDKYYAALEEQEPKGRLETIRFLVAYGMGYANSEIGTVFRELWSIAARNEAIERHLHEYYRLYMEEVTTVLAPYTKKSEDVSKVVSLIVPFYEGYGLISTPLPVDKTDMIDFLVRIIDSTLEGKLSGQGE